MEAVALSGSWVYAEGVECLLGGSAALVHPLGEGFLIEDCDAVNGATYVNRMTKRLRDVPPRCVRDLVMEGFSVQHGRQCYVSRRPGLLPTGHRTHRPVTCVLDETSVSD